MDSQRVFVGFSALVPRTLPARLTILYTSLFVALGGLALLSLHYLVDAAFELRMDEELLGRADSLAAVHRVGGSGELRRMMVLEAQASGERELFIRLLYPSGLSFSSSNMNHWESIKVDPEAISRLFSGNSTVLETRYPDPDGPPVRILYRLLQSVSRRSSGTPARIILQMGRTMSSAWRFRQVFRRVLLLLMSGFTLVAALAGWVTVRRALSGLGELTRITGEISGTDLSRRVPETGGSREVEQLSRSFNQMLARIEQLVTGIRTMSDDLAHDLKSPLTRLRIMAEMRREETAALTLPSGKEGGTARENTAESALMAGKMRALVNEMAADVMEECDRLLDTVNTMLTISRTESGIQDMVSGPVDMGQLARKAADLFLPAAEDRQIRLTVKTDGVCRVTGDRHLLQRCLANLLDNALKFTPEGGEVLAAVVAGSDRVEWVVEDTGIGIAKKDRSRIFDRFFRCDGSRTRRGAGLGLSLVRAVVAAHGGDIMMSGRPGEGTGFWISFPAHPPGSIPEPTDIP